MNGVYILSTYSNLIVPHVLFWRSFLTTSHTPLKYRGFIMKSKHIRPTYLSRNSVSLKLLSISAQFGMSTRQDLTVLPCTLEGKHFSSSSTKKREHLNWISFCVCRRCTCSWSLRAFHYSQHRLPSSPSFPPSSDFSFIQGNQEQQLSTSVERYT